MTATTTPADRPLAIVSAMHEELRALLPMLQDVHVRELGGRRFHAGRLHGHAVVLALSGIGKVAAASTTVLLLQAFQVRSLLFTGVAGGLHADVRVGDVVLARELLQHDMDASPLFPRYVVPLVGRSRFAADPVLGAALAGAVQRCLSRQDAPVSGARLHQGLVISGDRFVARRADSDTLRRELPDALAVEMEGAAVAQVCGDFGCPFAVLRTVSDRADDAAHGDFQRFVAEVASVYTQHIVGDWLGVPPEPEPEPGPRPITG